jgi:hypothetical protein
MGIEELEKVGLSFDTINAQQIFVFAKLIFSRKKFRIMLCRALNAYTKLNK